MKKDQHRLAASLLTFSAGIVICLVAFVAYRAKVFPPGSAHHPRRRC
jgi:hypothetical protein